MELAQNEIDLLLRSSATGDAAAFAELFRAYRHKLYGFILRATNSPEMAEDIIQDIFLKLWKDRANLTQIEQFGGYIYRMAQHQVINAMKRTARASVIMDELSKIQVTTAPDAESRLHVQEVASSLQSALDKLTPKQKLVYTLSREGGLKHEEIARHLNISPSTVNNHMIEALRMIRQQLHTSPEAFTVLVILLIFTA